jgi:hypothetical protein
MCLIETAVPFSPANPECKLESSFGILDDGQIPEAAEVKKDKGKGYPRTAPNEE